MCHIRGGGGGGGERKKECTEEVRSYWTYQCSGIQMYEAPAHHTYVYFALFYYSLRYVASKECQVVNVQFTNKQWSLDYQNTPNQQHNYVSEGGWIMPVGDQGQGAW